jgi:hypothetical protein
MPARSGAPFRPSPATSLTAARESPSQDEAPGDDAAGDGAPGASAANALKHGAVASNAARAKAGTKAVIRAIAARAAVETHCRNIIVTMNEHLADMDHNAH